MSLKIIRAGLLDTVQDGGRYGHRHLGINPGGAMDRFSASLANALLGNELNNPVIEMHFPGPEILFQNAAVACLTGADFAPLVNEMAIALHQPVIVPKGSVLRFSKPQQGARCYLALRQQLHLTKWLNSYSTHIKAGAGCFKGRPFIASDVVEFDKVLAPNIDLTKVQTLPWRYNGETHSSNEIRFLTGPEWGWLSVKAQSIFLNGDYTIAPASDRMGFRLKGEALAQIINGQLVSSPVNFGTVQLLPDGSLLVLMADHQTTGGYPRIATVISADLPRLAQRSPGNRLKFVMTTVAEAEAVLTRQQEHLLRLQNTCRVKLQKFFYED